MEIRFVDYQHLGGGKLTPESQAKLAVSPPPLVSTPLAQVRAESRTRHARELAAYAPATRAAIQRLGMAGDSGDIPIWVYTPPGAGPFPLLIYFHGGGWVLGAPEELENSHHFVATGAGCVVASVGYRLAPEHPYPAAAEDCYRAVCWAQAQAAQLNIDPARIALGGDSAGGNLTAAVTLMLRDRGAPCQPRLQILIYPATDLSRQDWPSYQECSAYGLSTEEVRWFGDQYVPDPQDQRQPYASPYLATDLSGLPPALVITAEFDVLRDDGEAYARRLEEAGVPVACSRYLGVTHGFANKLGIFPEAHPALTEIIAALREWNSGGA